MSNYSQTTFFTPKDSLPTTNPAKTIYGAAYDVEFGNISTAIATKYDSSTTSITLSTLASTGALTITAATGVTISAPSSGAALTVNGYAGAAQSITVTSSAGTNIAADILISRNGSTANSFATGPSIQLQDSTNNTQTIIQQSGGQTEFWQYNSGWNQVMYFTSSRGVVINAPASSTALYVNAASSGDGIVVNNSSAYSTVRSLGVTGTANTLGQGSSLVFGAAYVSSTYVGGTSLWQGSGGQTELWQYNSGWNQILNVASTRAVTINAATSNVSTLSVTAASTGLNSKALTLYGGFVSGSSVLSIQQTTSVASVGISFVGSATAQSAFSFTSAFYSTGSATPTLSANKPGSNSNVSGWIYCQNTGGTTVYIPFWT